MIFEGQKKFPFGMAGRHGFGGAGKLAGYQKQSTKPTMARWGHFRYGQAHYNESEFP